MKGTLSCAARAVRMYMPIQAAVVSSSSSSCEAPHTASAAGTEAPTSNEVQTARRLTDALMRSRAAQRQHDTAALPLHAKNAAPSMPVDEASAVAVDGQETMCLAFSYGRSALLTHLAHQQIDSATLRPYAYSAEDWARFMGERCSVPSSTATVPPATASSAFRSHSRCGGPHAHPEDGVTALLGEMEQTWATLSKEMKLRWVLSTPQGRRALRQATKTAEVSDGSGRRGRTPASPVDTVQHVPSMDEMLSKYSDVLVRPRLPRPAALSPAPKTHHLHKLFVEENAEGQRDHNKNVSIQKGEIKMHGIEAQDSGPNRATMRLKADAAHAIEREKVWFQDLARCLGGDNAVKFVNDVKSLQRPREENGEYEMRASAGNSSVGASSTASEEDVASHQGGSEPIYSTGLLDLCEELGIRNPRRAYVRSRVLHAVDDAANSAQPLTLDEVRELTTMYCAQYDKEVEAIAANATVSGGVSPEEAVRDFEKHQLELAVDKVRVKLSKFQDDIPLLRNCSSVLNK